MSSSQDEAEDVLQMVCDHCGEPLRDPVGRCSGCQSAFYCSRTCQIRDWEAGVHSSEVCRSEQRFAEQAAQLEEEHDVQEASQLAKQRAIQQATQMTKQRDVQRVTKMVKERDAQHTAQMAEDRDAQQKFQGTDGHSESGSSAPEYEVDEVLDPPRPESPGAHDVELPRYTPDSPEASPMKPEVSSDDGASAQDDGDVRVVIALDLDHTILHCTMEEPPASLLDRSQDESALDTPLDQRMSQLLEGDREEDLYHGHAEKVHMGFHRLDLGADALQRHGRRYLWIKFRPFVNEFLRYIAADHRGFLPVVYTHGRQRYAECILEIIDPYGHVFEGRVIARPEDGLGGLSGNDTQAARFRSKAKGVAEVQQLLARGRHALNCPAVSLPRRTVVVDDRVDAWDEWSAENILQVKPYEFFPDGIRAFPQVPFLDALEAREGSLSGRSGGSLRRQGERPGKGPQPARDVQLLDLMVVLSDVCTHFRKQHKLHRQFLATDQPDQREELEDGELVAVPRSNTLDQLEKSEKFLHDVSVPADVRESLATVRKEVLKGATILFSSIIPIEFPDGPEAFPLWKESVRAGATCVKAPCEQVTHVVTARADTTKVIDMRMMKPGVHVVHYNWILDSIASWRHVPEAVYAIFDDQLKLVLSAMQEVAAQAEAPGAEGGSKRRRVEGEEVKAAALPDGGLDPEKFAALRNVVLDAIEEQKKGSGKKLQLLKSQIGETTLAALIKSIMDRAQTASPAQPAPQSPKDVRRGGETTTEQQTAKPVDPRRKNVTAGDEVPAQAKQLHQQLLSLGLQVTPSQLNTLVLLKEKLNLKDLTVESLTTLMGHLKQQQMDVNAIAKPQGSNEPAPQNQPFVDTTGGQSTQQSSSAFTGIHNNNQFASGGGGLQSNSFSNPGGDLQQVNYSSNHFQPGMQNTQLAVNTAPNNKGFVNQFNPQAGYFTPAQHHSGGTPSSKLTGQSPFGTGHPNTGQSTSFGTGHPNAGQSSNFGTGHPSAGQSSNLGTGHPNSGQSSNFGTGHPNSGQSSNFGTGHPNAGQPTSFSTGHPNAGPTPNFSTGHPNAGPAPNFSTGHPNAGQPTSFSTGHPHAGQSTNFGSWAPSSGGPHLNKRPGQPWSAANSNRPRGKGGRRRGNQRPAPSGRGIPKRPVEGVSNMASHPRGPAPRPPAQSPAGNAFQQAGHFNAYQGKGPAAQQQRAVGGWNPNMAQAKGPVQGRRGAAQFNQQQGFVLPGQAPNQGYRFNGPRGARPPMPRKRKGMNQ